jgi:hypothetical protein
MAERAWENIKVRFCDLADCKVALQVDVLYPPENLPDGSRIVGERCSHGGQCMKFDTGRCMWSGVNPGYDPFVEKD